MDDPNTPERHINIHFSPDIMAGVYSNFANVSHSDYEFTITFARVDHEVEDEEIPGVVVSRINLSAALHAGADRRDAGQLLQVGRHGRASRTFPRSTAATEGRSTVPTTRTDSLSVPGSDHPHLMTVTLSAPSPDR